MSGLIQTQSFYMMNRFNLGFYLHINTDQHPWTQSTSNIINESSNVLAGREVYSSSKYSWASVYHIWRLQKTWIKPLNSYGFLYEYKLYETSTFWWNWLSGRIEISQVSLKLSLFMFWRWIKNVLVRRSNWRVRMWHNFHFWVKYPFMVH